MFLLFLIFQSIKTAQFYLLVNQCSAQSSQQCDRIWCSQPDGFMVAALLGGYSGPFLGGITIRIVVSNACLL